MRQSQRNQSRQRAAALNLVRSNPYINGYSMTGLLDPQHLRRRAGRTYFREWKPGIADVLQSGLAPLKWCLFLDSPRPYSCSPFTISGVLANEDILTEGRYPVSLRIAGEQGIVYEKELALNVARGDLRGLSVPVFCERVVLNVPSGDYVLRAELGGAAATCGELGFLHRRHLGPHGERRPVYLCSASEALRAFLKKAFLCARLCRIRRRRGGRRALRARLRRPVRCIRRRRGGGGGLPCRRARARQPLRRGRSAVRPSVSRRAVALAARLQPRLALPQGVPFKAPPVFSRPENRACRYRRFRRASQRRPFSGGRVPDETAAACFGTGLPCETGYDGGFNIGVYRFGRARLSSILSRFLKTSASFRVPASCWST